MSHEADCILQFYRDYVATEKRIELLQKLLIEAATEGGILTLSLESLQDNEMNVPVGPEIVLPYLQQELATAQARHKESSAKVAFIQSIINTKEVTC